MASLAMDLLEKVADAQQARNACFPEAACSPIVGLLLLATTAALDQWMLGDNNPIRGLSLTLVQMMMILGPLAADSTAAMAEADFQWSQGSDHPTGREIAHDTNVLKEELTSATDHMIRWRINQDRPSGIRHDRKMYSVILCIEELKYYDLFPTLDVIQTALKGYQLRMQTELITRDMSVGRARDGQGAEPADMDQSQ
jgi:hypothetical protein